MAKKEKKEKEVEITLRKEGSPDIRVNCPREIKMSFLKGFIYFRFHCFSPLTISPVNKKDLLFFVLQFLAIFISCVFFTVDPVVGLIIVTAVFVFNIIRTKNYYFNFIKKRLAEGYVVEDPEKQQLLQNAGLSNGSVSSYSSSGASFSTSSPVSSSSKPSQGDLTAQLEKLAALKEKGILSDEEFAAQKAKLLG